MEKKLPLSEKRRLSLASRSKPASHHWWQSILSGARKRGIKVSITPEYALGILVDQGFKCALSGKGVDANDRRPKASLSHRANQAAEEV